MLALQLRFLGRVDEVAAPRQRGTQRILQRDQGLLDARRAEPAGAEKAQHAGAGHFDDERFRCDAARHCAGDVGKAQAMHFQKGAVAKPFGIEGRQHAQAGIAGPVRCRAVVRQCTSAVRHPRRRRHNQSARRGRQRQGTERRQLRLEGCRL